MFYTITIKLDMLKQMPYIYCHVEYNLIIYNKTKVRRKC